MIASSRIARRKEYFVSWPELYDVEKPKPRREQVPRWLMPCQKNDTIPLCRRCRHRKLDLRPLMAKPPNIRELPDDPETLDLDEMENRYAVYIYDFSYIEAEATRSRCSLCALLYECLDITEQSGWLGYMRCLCTLRPRFDRSTNDKKRPTIIHKQQIWVEFQPIEGEIVLDIVNAKGYKASAKRRNAVAPTVDIELLRCWLKDCDAKHSHPDVPGDARSRVGDILDRGLFRAVNTSTGSVEVLTALPKFVALSYVWGQDAGQTKIRPLEGGPIPDYPATIRDSILMARSLGYEWIWVDRVCIDQANESEKAILIPYMQNIYTVAHLTIVAACGEGAQSGLFGTQHTPREAKTPLMIGPSFAVLPVTDRFDTQLSRSRWHKRGWTFQEHVFSRRLLFVLDSEMFFDCGGYAFRESTGRRLIVDNQGSIHRWLWAESSISESAALQAVIHKKTSGAEDPLTAVQFLHAVQEYSQRSLSVDEDRLPAFAGILSAAMGPLDRASQQAFLKHGHPLRYFETLLTWTDNRARCIDRETDNYSFPPPNSYVPSWSWASNGIGAWFKILGDPGDCDQYNWFYFCQLPNYDIIGLPTKCNPFAYLAGKKIPYKLVRDQQWIKELPHRGSNLNHDEKEVAFEPVSRFLSTPTLHLLTVVFEARIVLWKRRFDGPQHLLVSPENTEPGDTIALTEHLRDFDYNRWWFRPDVKRSFEGENLAAREHKVETFALITGIPHRKSKQGYELKDDVYFNVDVMMLEPTGQPDTYSRLGITTIDDTWKDDYFARTIRQGRPRWQYVHLV
ncbi:heterokaryon incompatibility protein-domain-containing protein [Nemania sp. FL0916]|nr:heterokaryon incompatibility protein-domain-containing protein [Nemania sp. FL0916]